MTNPSNRRIRNGFSQRRLGFTLVELLVVIGIIALLVGILLPTLSRARASANQIVCASNLRNIGQGFALYASDNKQFLPAAYVYTPGGAQGPGATAAPNLVAFPDVGGGSAQSRGAGYTHWSWLIFGGGATVPEDAFTSPMFDSDGGLPPTNPSPGDSVPGQQLGEGTANGFVDEQVRRVAYTVNEAIIPRNKFETGVPGLIIDGSAPNGARSQRVNLGRIRDSTNVILATEYIDNPRVVSEATGPGAGGGSTDFEIKSHRPVSGVNDAVTNDPYDATASGILIPAPLPPGVINGPSPALNSLGWVGRLHQIAGKKIVGGQPQDLRKTNFAYVDGHVETKLIEQTFPQRYGGDGFAVVDNQLGGDAYEWGNPFLAMRGTPRVRGVAVNGD
ncbi:MAG: type II secretion system protein [Planctomycetota bacterium]